MTGRVQILLPGLFDLPQDELETGFLDNRLPHFNRVLRFSTPRPNRSYSIDAIVTTAMGIESAGLFDMAPSLPIAPAFAGDGAHDCKNFLLAQAIHLQPDLHSAVIVPIESNQENLTDISNIIKDLNDLFKVNCYLTALADGLYLMRLNDFEAPTHYPHILSVIGKTANPYIEQSRLTLPWYKLLNEIQMFMHQHEINQQRLQRGSLPINSLWFWGAGSLPVDIDLGVDWFCDDSILNEFARSLGLIPRPCVEIAEAQNSRNALVIDLRLIEWLKTGMVVELDELLLDIDRSLLKPLLASVDRNRNRLILRAGFEFDFELKSTAGLKFWRRRKNLSSWSLDSNRA